MGIEKAQYDWLAKFADSSPQPPTIPDPALYLGRNYTENQELMAAAIQYGYQDAPGPLLAMLSGFDNFGHQAGNAQYRCEQLCPAPHSEFYAAPVAVAALTASKRGNASVFGACAKFFANHVNLVWRLAGMPRPDQRIRLACPAYRVKGAPSWAVEEAIYYLACLSAKDTSDTYDTMAVLPDDLAKRLSGISLGVTVIGRTPSLVKVFSHLIVQPRLAVPILRQVAANGDVLMQLDPAKFRGGNDPLAWVLSNASGSILASGNMLPVPKETADRFGQGGLVIGIDGAIAPTTVPTAPPATGTTTVPVTDQRQDAARSIAGRISALLLAHKDSPNRVSAIRILAMPVSPASLMHAAAIVAAFGINPGSPQATEQHSIVEALQSLAKQQ